jgi:hypothetical protein
MPTRAPTKDETWVDWMPNVPPTMGIVDFVRHVNAKLDSGYIAVEDLEAWQDDGVLPYPVGAFDKPSPDHGYPADAWVIIRDLLYEAHTRGIEDLEYLRQVTRGMATVIDNTASHSVNNLSWRDWMPVGSPMPDLLTHDQLLERLRGRGVDLTSASFQHYRQRGVLPRPIRRRYEGVTQAVYPDWFVPAIAQLRALQDQGKSLDEIKPWMRAWALTNVLWDDPYARHLSALRAPLRELAASVSNRADRITVTITDANGDELFRHELPAPGVHA